jgi:precorrin-2/cobalt-factor-2 C20-methyltransferase
MAADREGHVTATFYGIGLGPGDPELMTVKAARILREVDCVYHPASADGDSFAARIVAPLGIDASRLRPTLLRMSRDRRADRETYARIAADIARDLTAGRSAAWATEGDPLLYGTFLHLHEEVRRRVPEARIEIVPGVSSLHAATAQLGVAAASLDEKLAVVPAAYGLETLPDLLERFETVFLVKVHSSLDRLLDVLAGLKTPVRSWYLEKIGTPEARVVADVESLRGTRLPYFSLVLLKREMTS